MTGYDPSPHFSPDEPDSSFDVTPPSDSPDTSTKREVPPLFLTPKEKRRADDLTPPGLSNPFWR